MSLYHNQVQLAGRAGHDAELYQLTDGTPVARLRLYQSVVNHAGESTTTCFMLTAWNSLAEAFHRKVRRNDQLFVQGKLRIRSFRQDGATHLRPEIHLDSFHVLQRTGRNDTTATTAKEDTSVERT